MLTWSKLAIETSTSFLEDKSLSQIIVPKKSMTYQYRYGGTIRYLIKWMLRVIKVREYSNGVEIT